MSVTQTTVCESCHDTPFDCHECRKPIDGSCCERSVRVSCNVCRAIVHAEFPCARGSLCYSCWEQQPSVMADAYADSMICSERDER